MEWLKNPKNQPIVAGILIAVIAAVGIFYYFMFIKAPSSDQSASATPEATAPAAPAADGSAPAASPDAGAPPAGGAPAATPDPSAAPGAAPVAGATPAAAAAAPAGAKGAQVASVTPMETWRGDPFMPIGYKPRKKNVRVSAPIRDFPFMTLPGVAISRTVKRERPEIQQPPRRMAGILLNDRVYAIIESNGGSEVVQPGDYLKDRLAMVQKIEPDKVVLKTVDEKPRYITVKMAASAHQNAPAAAMGSVPVAVPSGPTMRPTGGPALGAPPPP